MIEEELQTTLAIENPGRLEALRRTRTLDTPAEPAFDRLTRVATAALGVPVALVTLIDSDRQFFKSQSGLPDPWSRVRETPLSHSLCKHVVASGESLVIDDARVDRRHADNPAVTDIGVGAYAGFPLVVDGHVIGSFCAIDFSPRRWSSTDLQILRDLADSVMSEMALKRAWESAEGANKSKDRFLAMLSHELRSPISPALLISGSLAADPTLPDSVRDDLRTIERNVRQQTRLIDDLLDVTRIENGKLSLQPERIDLHDLLAEVVGSILPEADKRGIDLSLTPAATRHAVDADPVRLRQVYGNLVRNSVKFTPRGGKVAVSTSDAPDGGLVVAVTDTGIGIHREVLPNVFNAFEQGSKAITDEFSGLGLGLAICKGLIEAAGGTVTARSDGPGKGATFTTILPTVDQPAPAVPTAPTGPRLAGRVILLVEDHKDTLKLMARLLTKRGHRVTPAESVTAAVAAAKVDPSIDLLITDVDLPDGSGLDLMAELSALRPVPGIALTGYGMESDLARSRAAGFAAHLVKPLNIADLEAAIAALG